MSETRIGISVQREYSVECTACGMVDGQPTRAKADRTAQEHAASHRDQGKQVRRFGTFHDAYAYAHKVSS